MRPLSSSSPIPDFPVVTRKKSRYILILFALLSGACFHYLRSNTPDAVVTLDTQEHLILSRKELLHAEREIVKWNANEVTSLQSQSPPKTAHISAADKVQKPLLTSSLAARITATPRLYESTTTMPLLQESKTSHRPNWKEMKNVTAAKIESALLANKKNITKVEPQNALISNYIDPFKYFTFEQANFDQYALNIQLSQSLPLHRPIAELRCKLCLGRQYLLSRPHKVSIIVPFHNEMWAVLLRTIHSLLDHSPSELLHEIIMIDDFSNFDNLLTPLTRYLRMLEPKVKLIRLKQREGLIRARMVGARAASGDLLAFIDAHVEVTKGWMEPLVDLVSRERTTIAVPVINSIDPQSFNYIQVPIKSTGVFTWDLDYVWKDENVRYDTLGIAPHPTATMIGCAFIVDREFFFNVGSFDEGMDIWGGEQIEISFRTWMCGGSVKIVPCSHVGHIYRAHLPYAFDKYILYRNLQRIAEVWMDDHKRYFYLTIQADPHKLTPEEHRTIQVRKDLRRRLQCKPFAWYLETVAPDVTVPTIGAQLYGNVRNIGSQLCLCQKNTTQFDFHEVIFDFCSLQTRQLTFTFLDSGHLMYEGQCLAYRDTKDSAVTFTLCDQNDPRQLWRFSHGLPDAYQNRAIGADAKRAQGSFQLKYGAFSLCLSQMRHGGADIAGALDCGAANPHQYWIVTYQLYFGRNFRDVYPQTGANSNYNYETISVK